MVQQPANLRVERAGLKLKKPFLLASASPTLTGAMIAKAFEHGWAGAVTKTLKPPSLRRSWVSREPQPMLGPLKYGGRLIGMPEVAEAGDLESALSKLEALLMSG